MDQHPGRVHVRPRDGLASKSHRRLRSRLGGSEILDLLGVFAATIDNPEIAVAHDLDSSFAKTICEKHREISMHDRPIKTVAD